mmetsp:Transcript_11201/g.16050  ORF Transcript_11201/g.16050 Transcript_11201/m.16050 type:complete len:221 (-) Transcript_11201:405-1067(-)
MASFDFEGDELVVVVCRVANVYLRLGVDGVDADCQQFDHRLEIVRYVFAELHHVKTLPQIHFLLQISHFAQCIFDMLHIEYLFHGSHRRQRLSLVLFWRNCTISPQRARVHGMCKGSLRRAFLSVILVLACSLSLIFGDSFDDSSIHELVVLRRSAQAVWTLHQILHHPKEHHIHFLKPEMPIRHLRLHKLKIRLRQGCRFVVGCCYPRTYHLFLEFLLE